ncbi:MAG: hypothetical protein WAV32_08180, partial [Halobacteriota archaeon]
ESIDDDGQSRHNSSVHLLIKVSNGESIKLPEEVHHIIMLPINTISRQLAQKILSWCHTGFSVHRDTCMVFAIILFWYKNS